MVFESEWHSTVTTPIPADVDPDSLINVLHDHSFLITCSPIVTRHNVTEQDSQTGWVRYQVFEVIEMIPFGLLKREIAFQCCFKDKADGVVSFIDAPMGIISEAHYTVKQTNGGGAGEEQRWILEEEIESSCSVLLKAFVQSNMIPVRKKLHQQAIEAARRKHSNHLRKEGTVPAIQMHPSD